MRLSSSTSLVATIDVEFLGQLGLSAVDDGGDLGVGLDGRCESWTRKLGDQDTLRVLPSPLTSTVKSIAVTKLPSSFDSTITVLPS